jgi:hypothetical protein
LVYPRAIEALEAVLVSIVPLLAGVLAAPSSSSAEKELSAEERPGEEGETELGMGHGAPLSSTHYRGVVPARA